MAESKIHLDSAAIRSYLRKQFTGLDPNDPSVWPSLPRNLLCLALCFVVVVLIWFVWLKSVREDLMVEKLEEEKLRGDYTAKLVQAVNLDALKKQLEQVQQYVTQLERQLPSKAEMDALLSDINQAGIGRSLQFELFRPGQEIVREYHVELPIEVRVSGRYHDMGLFAADVANLSRIVTLNNLSLAPVAERDGILTMETTARTFRYLDQEEIELQRKANEKTQSNAGVQGGGN